MDKNKSKQNRKGATKGSKRTGRMDDRKKSTLREGYEGHTATDNNDLEWYVVDSNMLNDVASLPFSNRLIDEQDMHVLVNSVSPAQLDFSVDTPGIMTLWFDPSYGSAYNADPSNHTDEWKADALNIAAKSIYSFVRKHNSGSANYDEVDLMEYIISMDSVYMYWSYLVRLYGVMRTYNFKNAYMPKAVIQSMGLSLTNFDQLITVMPQLRNVINTLAIKMSSLAVPTVMPILRRHLWMMSNVYMDCDDPKAQLYLFNNATYYAYNEVDGRCDSIDFYAELSSWRNATTANTLLNKIYKFGTDMLDKLLYSQSIGIMSGDVLKAYEGNVYQFGTISEDYSVIPQYYEKLLPEIHNATVSGWRMGNIIQVDNCLYTDMGRVSNTFYENPNGKFEALLFDQEHLLNVPYQAPTPEDVMYATRLMCGTRWIDATPVLQLVSGSENFIGFWINRSAVSGAALKPWSNISALSATDDYETQANDLRTHLDLVSTINKFDWAPMVWMFHVDDASAPSTVSSVDLSADISNFTVVSNEVLRRIHNSAFCGLYGIPYTLLRA